MKKSIVLRPNTLGWLEYKLNPKEMDYVWRCIDKKSKEKANDALVGHISGSYYLQDKSDWFWMNTIRPLIGEYEEEFGSMGKKLPTNQRHPYYLKEWWVNYQRQGEFNPLHDHRGVYSYVIWMKIPYNHRDQQKIQCARQSNDPQNGVFCMYYMNILGKMMSHQYQLTSEDEGTMLFFPSSLNHGVNPYFECEEERISVSGNVCLNTAKSI